MDNKRPEGKTVSPERVAYGHTGRGYRGHGKLPSREKIREIVRKKLEQRSSLTSKSSSNPGMEQK